MTTRNRPSYIPLESYICPGCKTSKPREEFFPYASRAWTSSPPRRRKLCNGCYAVDQKTRYETRRDALISDRALAAFPQLFQKAVNHPTKGVAEIYTQLAHIIADDHKHIPHIVEIFLESYKQRVNEHARLVKRKAEGVVEVE